MEYYDGHNKLTESNTIPAPAQTDTCGEAENPWLQLISGMRPGDSEGAKQLLF
jgi:hypothetical protein